MDKLLKKMSDKQVQYKPLYCTGSNNCWCAYLKFRIPYREGYHNCMSPGQILLEHEKDMDKEDVSYLKSLMHRPFIY